MYAHGEEQSCLPPFLMVGSWPSLTSSYENRHLEDGTKNNQSLSREDVLAGLGVRRRSRKKILKMISGGFFLKKNFGKWIKYLRPAVLT